MCIEHTIMSLMVPFYLLQDSFYRLCIHVSLIGSYILEQLVTNGYTIKLTLFSEKLTCKLSHHLTALINFVLNL